MFNVDPSSRSTSFFILVITVLIKNVRWFLLKSSKKFIRIFKVVLLFSCQRSFCDPLLVCKKLYYFITVLFVCQELFNLFCCSKLFCSATTFISYHLSPCLSRSFLMIFIMYRSDRSPSVTFTYYHIIFPLSRTYFIYDMLYFVVFQRRWLYYHEHTLYVKLFFTNISLFFS